MNMPGAQARLNSTFVKMVSILRARTRFYRDESVPECPQQKAQCIDDHLSAFPRIGTAPSIKGEADITRASQHYMNYQAMVQKLKSVYADELDTLRRRHNESYAYDIRILV